MKQQLEWLSLPWHQPSDEQPRHIQQIALLLGKNHLTQVTHRRRPKGSALICREYIAEKEGTGDDN